MLSTTQGRVAKSLVDYFRSVSQPTSVFSPFNRRIVAELADILEQDPMPWLLDASETRTALETSLLLPAGIHRQVLLGHVAAQELRQFYPSVGGTVPANDDDNDHKDNNDNNRFHAALRKTMEASREMLVDTIRNDTVQTNETARGLVWLFPTMLTGWDRVDHLIDLGASAGLNLVADQRTFELRKDTSATANETRISVNETKNSNGKKKDDNLESLLVGKGTSPNGKAQFSVDCSFIPASLSLSCPTIVSRTGCDLNPFKLETEEDRARLQSYIWPDQLDRLERLQEGIAAHQSIRATQEIPLQAVSLPHGLPGFLQSIESIENGINGNTNNNKDNLDQNGNRYVVIYNTYMTEYLENHGQDLRGYIGDWARSTNQTVLWAQSEPAREEPLRSLAPVEHWCLWSVDLWEGNTGEHKRWNLAWVHPHLKRVDWFVDELDDFATYFQ